MKTNTRKSYTGIALALAVLGIALGAAAADSDADSRTDSQQQAAVLLDGVVTEAEYLGASARFADCAQRHGLTVAGLRFVGGHLTYDDIALGSENDARAVATNEASLDQCWASNLRDVERSWMRQSELPVRDLP